MTPQGMSPTGVGKEVGWKEFSFPQTIKPEKDDQICFMEETSLRFGDVITAVASLFLVTVLISYPLETALISRSSSMPLVCPAETTLPTLPSPAMIRTIP